MTLSGAELRDVGMANAAEAQEFASWGWGDRAYGAILFLARRQPYIHVDDVIASFTESPLHPNAWGAVWKKAIGDGIIARTGSYRHSSDPKKHKHVYPVYQSRVAA